MLHLPTPMLMGDADPYAKWLAYVNAITATDIAAPNSSSINSVGFVPVRFVFPVALDGAMQGTPIGSVGLGLMSFYSHLTRIAQHAFSTDALRVANQGRVVLLQITNYGAEAANFASNNRNGYVSDYFAGPYSAGYCVRFEYLNPTTGRRVFGNPRASTWAEFDL